MNLTIKQWLLLCEISPHTQSKEDTEPATVEEEEEA